MSEEKFSKCEEGEKCLSVEFRVFGKKNERRISEKKIKVFLGEILKCEILLSSYSLVGLYVNLQVLREKKRNFQSVFGKV